MAGSSVQRSNKKRYAFEITATSGRIYLIEATDQQDRDEWVAAIDSCV